MANEEQLAILKQGVEVWNKWKEENRLIDIDLSGANLGEAILPGVHLGYLFFLDYKNEQQVNLREITLNGLIF